MIGLILRLLFTREPEFLGYLADKLGLYLNRTPSRPAPPTVRIASNRETHVLTATITPSPFADATIVKATITPTVNGTPGTPTDTTGAPITLTVKVGDVVTSTETVTNHAGNTSVPSDPSAPVTVVDPAPAKPAPPTIAISGTVDAPAA